MSDGIRPICGRGSNGDLRREARVGQRRWWTAAAAVAAMVLIGFGVWSWQPGMGGHDELLADHALAEVERAEALHLASIERLARLAGPRIEEPATALMAAYAEKLTMLDAAIAELRAEIDRNRFNTHLRVQMGTLYRDKRKTLEEVLRYDPELEIAR